VPYGKVEKCFLRTRDGGYSTAFVTFSTHQEAKRAMEALDGCGFRYLVLHIEWAKETVGGAFGAGGGGGGGLANNAFVSGYGKALPQNRGTGPK